MQMLKQTKPYLHFTLYWRQFETMLFVLMVAHYSCLEVVSQWFTLRFANLH